MRCRQLRILYMTGLIWIRTYMGIMDFWVGGVIRSIKEPQRRPPVAWKPSGTTSAYF